MEEPAQEARWLGPTIPPVPTATSRPSPRRCGLHSSRLRTERPRAAVHLPPGEKREERPAYTQPPPGPARRAHALARLAARRPRKWARKAVRRHPGPQHYRSGGRRGSLEGTSARRHPGEAPGPAHRVRAPPTAPWPRPPLLGPGPLQPPLPLPFTAPGLPVGLPRRLGSLPLPAPASRPPRPRCPARARRVPGAARRACWCKCEECRGPPGAEPSFYL